MPRLITLKLDKELLKKMEERIKDGFYSSRTDYIRDLIREDILHSQREQERKIIIERKRRFMQHE